MNAQKLVTWAIIILMAGGGMLGLIATITDAAPSPFNQTGASGASQAPMISTDPTFLPIAADELIRFGPEALAAGLYEVVVAAQLERTGAVSAGYTRTVMDAHAPAAHSDVAGGRGIVPDHKYRDAFPVCDVDGDGVEDVVVNRLEPLGRGSVSPADIIIEMHSGIDGRELWSREHFQHLEPAQGVLNYVRGAEPGFGAPDNLFRVGDLDGDGVCDLIVYGTLRFTFASVPIWATASIGNFSVTVAALSGATGDFIWSQVHEGSVTTARDVLVGSYAAARMENIFTGLMIVPGVDGPLLMMKTTDVVVTEAHDPGLVGTAVPVFNGPYDTVDREVTDHVTLMDAATGNVHWVRDILTEENQATVATRWITSLAQLTNDNHYDLLVEEVLDTNPQSDSVFLPMGIGQAADAGRGLQVRVLDGDPAGTGEDVWVREIVPPEAARPAAGFEENRESLIWSHILPLPDLDEDGYEELGLRYMAAELGLSGTPLGDFKTHVVPLAGFDGTPLWDVRVQGWASIQSLGTDHNAPIALGTADLTAGGTQATNAGRAASQHARILVVDPLTGETMWNIATPFPTVTGESYDLIMAQFMKNLAPYDLNGDGIRDPLGAAEHQAEDPQEQSLMATTQHQYQVHDAMTGDPLFRFGTFGAHGLNLVCEGADMALTVISGHSRRIDATRFDARLATVDWRTPLVNDPAPRAATSGVSMTGLDGRCQERDDGTTFVTMNLGRSSFERGYHVIGVYGILEADGTPRWLIPEAAESPAFQPFIKPFAELQTAASVGLLDGALWTALLVGLVMGALAVPLIKLIRARRAAGGLKGTQAVSILLLVAFLGPAAMAMPMDRPSAPEAWASPSPQSLSAFEDSFGPNAPVAAEPKPQAGLGPTHAPSSNEEPTRTPLPKDWVDQKMARARAFEEANGQDAIPGFDQMFLEEDAYTYTWTLSDVDGDGQEDVLLDAYCLYSNSFDCTAGFENNDVLTVDYWESTLFDYTCSELHYAVAVSGATGEILWTRSMKEPAMLATFGSACVWEYVIGTVPLGRGETGVLIYRHQQFYPTFFTNTVLYVHNLTMVSGRTGEVVWEWSEVGEETQDLQANVREGANTEVNPIILPGVGPDGATNPSLLLQSVGFREVHESFTAHPEGLVGVPGTTYSDTYEPNEWVAEIDIKTGNELWRTNTFQPGADRSVLPFLVTWGGDWDWLDFIDLVPPRAETINWRFFPCCGDVTGDGKPDLAFSTIEWSKTPAMDVDGPYVLASRLVVFDGASGAPVIDLLLDTDIVVQVSRPISQSKQYSYQVVPRAIGDADGDGRDDILVLQEFQTADLTNRMRLVSSASGQEVWRVDVPRQATISVIGDVNNDGAPDIAQAMWFAYDLMQQVLPDVHEYIIRSGATGEIISRIKTGTAPIDIVYQFQTARLNGISDLNDDGAGELLVDDPVALDDQTLVHQLDAHDVRADASLWGATSVGNFAHPSRAPDVNGDGIDDVALVSGDANDLWLTLYDGEGGEALWSRRILRLPVSGFTEAIPQLRIDALWNDTRQQDDILVTFQFKLTTLYTGLYITFCTDCASPYGVSVQTRTEQSALTQISVLRAEDGALHWETPGTADQGIDKPVAGATPATQQLLFAIAESQKGLGTRAWEAAIVAAPMAAFWLVGAGLGALVALGIARVRNRDGEVLDLDI